MAEAEILGPSDNDEVTISTIQPMDAATTSEINLQVEFAMKHKRSITDIRKELETLVTLDQKIAEESFYTLKRKDKDGNTKLIQGPSVRFAEVLVYSWGNTRSGIQISDIDNEFVTGEGVFMDLQRNNVIRIRTKRRITDKTGRKYNTDMIQTTGNAAASLAYRNAVTRGIPRALWNDILEKAKVIATGGSQSIAEKRNAAIEYGKKIGVSPEQIYSTLGVQGINDLGIDELIALKGLYNAVKDNESTIEEAFGDPFEKEIMAMMEQLGWNKTKKDLAFANHRGKSLDLVKYLKEQLERISPAKKETKNEEPEAKTAKADKEPAKTEEPTVEKKEEVKEPEKASDPETSKKSPSEDLFSKF